MELAALYDGGLTFEPPSDRPLVIANFVSSLDGVVSYDLLGRSGGGEISDFNQPAAGTCRRCTLWRRLAQR